MTTFTLNNGHTFMKKDNGHCYAIVKNTKTRIALPVFNANYEQFVKEENERQNAANEFTNIDTLIAETEESNATEAGEEIAAEMLGGEIDMEKELEVEARMLEEYVGKKAPKAKKERKPRKSKNTAYTFSNGGVEFNLTTKQVDFIRHLPDTCFWQDGLDSAIWIDCLCDEIKGQFSNKPMTVGAMVSTLCEKGLGARATGRVNGRKCTSFQLTAWGKAVAKDLGLE